MSAHDPIADLRLEGDPRWTADGRWLCLNGRVVATFHEPAVAVEVARWMDGVAAIRRHMIGSIRIHDQVQAAIADLEATGLFKGRLPANGTAH